MNPRTYEFLVGDHLRTLNAQAQSARRSALARQESSADLDGRTGITIPRFEIVRRLVARLAAA